MTEVRIGGALQGGGGGGGYILPQEPDATGAGHTLTMSSGGWEKAHMIFWDSYRTDTQKKQNAAKVLPWLVAA